LKKAIETISASGAVWIEPILCGEQVFIGDIFCVGECSLPGGPARPGDVLHDKIWRNKARGQQPWSLYRPLRAHYQRFATPQEEGRDEFGESGRWMRALIYHQDQCLGIILFWFLGRTSFPQDQLNKNWLQEITANLIERHTRRAAALVDTYIFCDAQGQCLGLTHSAKTWAEQHNVEIGPKLLGDVSWAPLHGALLEVERLEGEQPCQLIVIKPPPLVSLDPVAELNARQRQVLTLTVQGMSNAKIGEALNISVNTVKYHVKQIYELLGTSNKIELIQSLGASRLLKLSAELHTVLPDNVEEGLPHRVV
jgi:DNA-binding CsgD family transcriptional regulator